MAETRSYSSYSSRPSSYSSYQGSSTSYPSSALGGSNEMRGTDILAEYLVKEKVPYVLGYAGHGAIGLLDGIYKVTDRIKHISPRIEQTAGFMADVYYRLTGQPLAVYASTGPGPMNLMITVANAYYDNSAFFVITGNVPTNQLDSGALQDDYRYHGDMSSMFTPIVKKSWRIRKVEDLVKALPDAFSMMRIGPAGPRAFRHALRSLHAHRAGDDARPERARRAAQLAHDGRRRDDRAGAQPADRRAAPAHPRRRRRPGQPRLRGAARASPSSSTFPSIRRSWARARCPTIIACISASRACGANFRRRRRRATQM